MPNRTTSVLSTNPNDNRPLHQPSTAPAKIAARSIVVSIRQKPESHRAMSTPRRPSKSMRAMADEASSDAPDIRPEQEQGGPHSLSTFGKFWMTKFAHRAGFAFL